MNCGWADILQNRALQGDVRGSRGEARVRSAFLTIALPSARWERAHLHRRADLDPVDHDQPADVRRPWDHRRGVREVCPCVCRLRGAVVSLDMAHLAIGFVRTAPLVASGKSAVFHLHVNFEVDLFRASTHVSRWTRAARDAQGRHPAQSFPPADWRWVGPRGASWCPPRHRIQRCALARPSPERVGPRPLQWRH